MNTAPKYKMSFSIHTHPFIFGVNPNAKMAKRKTPLNAILADMDEVFLPDGTRKIFEIEYYLKDGTFRKLKKAVKTGLKMNMKANDMKGIQEVNSSGVAIGHITPVWIHAIRSYTSKTMKYEY